jgi:hypothetical protein
MNDPEHLDEAARPESVRAMRDIVSPATLSLAAEAAKLARLYEVPPAIRLYQETARALEVPSAVLVYQEATRNLDLSGFTAASETLRRTNEIASISESFAEANRFNAKAMKAALGVQESELFGQLRQTLETLDLSATWLSQIVETFRALRVSEAFGSQIQEAMAQAVASSRMDYTPRFAFAVAEAARLAETADLADAMETEAVESLPREQRDELAAQVLDLVGRVALVVALIAGSADIALVAAVVAVLASLIVIYSRLRE